MRSWTYIFKHALVQDTAYQSLLKKDRGRLHRAVAEAFERAFPDQLDENAGAAGAAFRASRRTRSSGGLCAAERRAMPTLALLMTKPSTNWKPRLRGLNQSRSVNRVWR